jgi:hypothetical protein
MAEYHLPVVEDEMVAQFQADYDTAFNSGTEEELNSAKMRCGPRISAAGSRGGPARPEARFRSPLAHRAARRRLIWAMVHSSRNLHVERGLHLARTTLEYQGADRELEYMIAGARRGPPRRARSPPTAAAAAGSRRPARPAPPPAAPLPPSAQLARLTTSTSPPAAVALFNLGRNVEARKKLRELLERHPDMHQAAALKASVDDQVVKEGLMGVGIAAGVVGVGLALLFGSRK